MACETRALAHALRAVERPDEMAAGVESLERRQQAARERLEGLLLDVKTIPTNITTNQTLILTRIP